MKTLKQLLLYSLLLLIFTNGSCVKPEIPTGDNSFSCYINGELFVPKGSSDIGSTLPINSDGLIISENESFFQASAGNQEKYLLMFNIVDWDESTFNLSVSDGNYYNHNISHAMLNVDGIWYHSKDNSGTVTFIEANIEGNTTGTFEFTLYNENDIIHVTDGNFDD